MKPSLELFTPINRGSKFITDISQDAIGWRRSIRSLGGYWMGTFRIEAKTRYYKDITDLLDKFYNWLGCEIVERSYGFMTWQGIIYSMDLTHKGMTRRRSLDLMSNYVKVEYEDDEGESQTTDAAENTASSGIFGRKENIITYDGIGTTAATAFRDRYLKENGHPYPRVVGVDPTRTLEELGQSETTLEVSCCGYCFTGNWRYESIGDGSVDNLSDWITEIVNTDMEFIDVGVVNSNTLQIYKINSSPRRAWDVIAGLVEIGDTDGDPYYCMVGNNRLLYYGQIDTNPRYYLRDGQVYSSPAGNSPTDIWKMRPAVIRDMDYPVSRTLSGGWLTNIRDFYAYELDCGLDTGLTIKTELYDESELLVSLASFLQSNKRAGEEDKD